MDLILLANGFPYGSWEPFLETEARYYRGFDSVHVCAMQVRREHLKTVRPLPSDRFHVCTVPFAPMPVYFFEGLGALLDGALWRELRALIRSRRFTLKRLAWLFFYVGRSHHEARIIHRYLRSQGLTDPDAELLLYSYRFDYQPYTALLLKKRLPRCALIARGHRYDLYEEERPSGYIPMRELLLERVDRLILIAEHGRRYIAARFPGHEGKLTVSRLGTLDRGLCPARLDGGPLRIVSCSTVSDVKRVHLIAEALALLPDAEIEWTHFGEGDRMEALRRLCEGLPANIRWTLAGHVGNAELLAEYARTPRHLFVNVSSSEGIPVSIMEAMSFGIPCLATDVGGTGELVVTGENGTLLPAELTPARLADELRAFASMPDEAYQRYRDGARRSWQERYDADKNYTAFADDLLRMAEDGLCG